MLDIQIDIKCLHCGYIYRDGFRDMPHGKSLKCPICFSAKLTIMGDVLIDEHSGIDAFDLLLKNDMTMSRFKL